MWAVNTTQNYILINVNLVVLYGFFWSLCGSTILFTSFVKSITCHLTIGFYMHMFFPLVGPHDFCPFVLHHFFPIKCQWGKKYHHLFVFEWLYIAWKQEYTFVLCLLPTWASNMWSNHIIWKEFYLLSM
jgi:hypothetical protein